MAARKRAQERDFNRRRWIVLDKGLDMAYNQKGTSLGECLLKWNVREQAQLQMTQKLLQRQGEITVGFRDQEKNRFVVTRDQATREPTLLLERTPSAEQYPDFVDVNQPRYMRPLNSRQSKTPEFSTFSVFQAVKKRKRNPWEEVMKEAVQFRPTLCPCPRLNRQDTEKLLTDWVVVNEMQTKALGLRTDNRSAPVKHVRSGPNPLNLPSRLNSRLHHLAQDLLDDLSATDASSSDSGETEEPLAEPDVDSDDGQREPPVFVTQQLPPRVTQLQPLQKQQDQMKQQQQQQQQLHQEFALFEARDTSQKEKRLSQKQAVDGALVSIYDMLERRRVAGRPRVRSNQRRQPAGDSSLASVTEPSSAGHSGAPSRASTAAFLAAVHHHGNQQPPLQFRTTCRSAQSIQILMESRRQLTQAPAHATSADS